MAVTRSRGKKTSYSLSRVTTTSGAVSGRVQKRGKKSQDGHNRPKLLRSPKGKVPPKRTRPAAPNYGNAAESTNTSSSAQPPASQPTPSVPTLSSNTQPTGQSPYHGNRAYRSIEDAETEGRAHSFNQYTPENYSPGTILMTKHHNEDSDPGSTFQSNKEGVYNLMRGGEVLRQAIYAKQRFMVVVRCFQGHYVALPAYSFQTLGLSTKSEDQRHEYIPLKYPMVPFQPANQSIPVPSKYDPLVVKYLYRHIHELKPSTVIHLTEPVSIRFTRHTLLAGKLTTDSLEHLLKLYAWFQGGPLRQLGLSTRYDSGSPSASCPLWTVQTQFGNLNTSIPCLEPAPPVQGVYPQFPSYPPGPILRVMPPPANLQLQPPHHPLDRNEGQIFQPPL
jgi:hypothetical protein